MMVLREWVRGAIHLQVLECDCGEADCDHRVILANLRPAAYWAVMAIVPERLVDEQLDEILEAPETIAHGIALMGVARSRLAGSKVECLRQFNTWMGMPDWVARVPIETVWRVRRAVFGDDFTRTIRALKALDSYVPELEEGPVPAPSLEALFERQMRVAYPPEKRSMS